MAPPRVAFRFDRSRRATTARFAAAATILFLILFVVVAPPERPHPFSRVRRALLLDPKTVQPKTTTSSSLQPRPTGLRLLLVGDPDVHATYLSLAHYLRRGEWRDIPVFDDDEVVSFREFYARTTASLYPREVCDCEGDPEEVSGDEEGGGRAFRVYRDPVLDNAVVYLPSPAAAVASSLGGGSDPSPPTPTFRAHLWPCLSLKAIEGGYDLGTVDEYLAREASDPRRQRSFLGTKDWSEAVKFISDHMFLTPDEVGRLRPTHVAIGPGPNGGGLCGDARRAERVELIETLRAAGMAPVWLRTTALEEGGCGAEVDREMCDSEDVLCLDAAEVTSEAGVGPQGGVHGTTQTPPFERPAYRALSERLLELIERTSHPTGSSRI